MTTETCNARGEWVLVPRVPTPEMVQASNDISCRAEGEEHWAAMLAAAPPPAAARGDVRGLVADRQAWFESEIAKAERQWIDGFHDRYEAGDDVPSMDHFVALWLAERTEALAAEGVQAGEVEQRARELLAAECIDLPAVADVILNAPHDTLPYLQQAAIRAIASALSQQPEARGGVDEAMVERIIARAERETNIDGMDGDRWDRILVRAALTAAQQQGGGEAVAWCALTPSGKIAYFDGSPMVMVGPVGNEHHTTPLYTAPPIAPVGVKVLARDVHYAIRDAGLAPEAPAADAAMRNAILAVLAQQPAAVDGAGDSHHG